MSLKKNIINLFGTQVVSYLVPLLQFPYLSRVIGTELLGLYIFSLSLVTIGLIITNFGFDISVSKRIAEGENSPQHLGTFLHQITRAKTILVLLAGFVLSAAMFFSGYYQHNPLAIFCILLAIIGNAYSLNWLFQGLEKIYVFSRATIITKLVSLAAIFILVKTIDDFNWLLILLAIQAIATTVICYVVARKWGIKSIKSSAAEAWSLTKESSEFFMSRVGVSLYSTCGSFFLGILSSSLHQVAIYGVAEQLYKAGVYAVSAIATPLTPYMARTKNYSVFFKVTLISLVITIFGALIGYFWGELILTVIFGPELVLAKDVLNIFMITIIISVIGIHFGYPALIPLNKVKIANYSVIYAGILQAILLTIIYLTRTPATAILIATTYLLCDLLMTTLRLGTFIKVYKHFEG